MYMHAHDGEPKVEPHNPIQPFVLKLMVVIVDEPRTERVTNFLRERFVRFQFACGGEGTANSDLLDLLGLGGTEKTLFFCLLPDFHAEELMRIMPEKLELQRKGKGIAFTIPLSGLCNPLQHVFNEEFAKKLIEMIDPARRAHIEEIMKLHLSNMDNAAIKERMARIMESEPEKPNAEALRHDLIIAVVNQGGSEELMNAARTAGAGGGTVVNARRTGLDDGSTFLGMPIQTQKDIVLILSDRRKKNAIMKAINHDFGLTTEWRGIVFSLPVDSVAGIAGITSSM